MLGGCPDSEHLRLLPLSLMDSQREEDAQACANDAAYYELGVVERREFVLLLLLTILPIELRSTITFQRFYAFDAVFSLSWHASQEHGAMLLIILLSCLCIDCG